MNTLVSVVLSALQDTRDGGYTVEERAEAIAAAVRAETPESGALSQWIASLRVGDTLTVDDIHRFVRVELALRNADKHHQQARDMTAERDEWRDAAKWSENQHQYWKTVAQAAKAQRDEAVRELEETRKREALSDAIVDECDSDITKLVQERATLRARLAACERVVEAAVNVELAWREMAGEELMDAEDALRYAVRAYRAAVTAVAAETCARSAPITAGDTQGETDADYYEKRVHQDVGVGRTAKTPQRIAKTQGERDEHAALSASADADTESMGAFMREMFGKYPNATRVDATPTPHAGGTDA